jgi:hypothetical protein
MMIFALRYDLSLQFVFDCSFLLFCGDGRSRTWGKNRARSAHSQGGEKQSLHLSTGTDTLT